MTTGLDYNSQDALQQQQTSDKSFTVCCFCSLYVGIKRICRNGNCLEQWPLRLMGNVVSRVCIGFSAYLSFLFILFPSTNLKATGKYRHPYWSHDKCITISKTFVFQCKRQKYQQPEQSNRMFRRIFLSVKLKSVAVLCFVFLIF